MRAGACAAVTARGCGPVAAAAVAAPLVMPVTSPSRANWDCPAWLSDATFLNWADSAAAAPAFRGPGPGRHTLRCSNWPPRRYHHYHHSFMSAASGRAIRASAAAAPCQGPSRMLPSARQVSSACCDSQLKALSARKMIVSVLEAGFLWRVRVLQGPAARHGIITSASSCPWCLQVRMASPASGCPTDGCPNVPPTNLDC